MGIVLVGPIYRHPLARLLPDRSPWTERKEVPVWGAGVECGDAGAPGGGRANCNTRYMHPTKVRRNNINYICISTSFSLHLISFKRFQYDKICIIYKIRAP